MGYVRLDDQIAAHPKVLRAGPEAAWLWVAAIAYCNRQLTDGLVPREALPTLGAFKTASTKLAATLVAVGLFDVDPEGYRVHDYLTHNPDRATVQQRMREARERTAASRARHSVTRANVTRLSQRDSDETSASSRATRTSSPPPDLSSLRSERDARAPEPADGATWGPPPTQRRKAALAWEGLRRGLGVPHELHAELLSKMAQPDEAALLAWYADTETAWQGRAVGDTCWQFWNRRFAEWQGSTPTASRVAGLAGGGVPAARPRAVAVEDPDYRGSRYRFHCAHQPTCTTWPECRDHDQAEVSA